MFLSDTETPAIDRGELVRILVERIEPIVSITNQVIQNLSSKAGTGNINLTPSQH